MPALNPLTEEAYELQMNFVKSGGVGITLNMLTKNNFMPSADLFTRRSAYHVVFKICKLLLTAVGYAQVQVVADACQSDSTPPPTPSVHQHALVLQQALHHIPNPNAECMTRNVAVRLGQQLGEQVSPKHFVKFQ